MAAARQRRRRSRSPLTVGLIALAIIVVGVCLGFTKDIPFTHGFRVKATFASANSLRLNSPVRIAGVEVGKVKKIEAKEGTDEAVVTMEIKKSGAADPRGRDRQDPPAHLPRGQLLRRPAAGHAVVPEARGRRRHQGHADGDPGAARPGADRAAERHPPGPPRRPRRPRRRPQLQADRGRRRDADRSARGQTGAESLNDAYDDVARRAEGHRPGQRRAARHRARPRRRAAARGHGEDDRRADPQREPAQGPDHELQHDDGGVRERGGQPQRARSACSRRRSRTPTPRSPRSTPPSRRRARSRARSCPACARRRRRSRRRSRGSTRPAAHVRAGAARARRGPRARRRPTSRT